MMNANATYHTQRRDALIKAARTLMQAKRKSTGSVQVMKDCVQKARYHNHLAMFHRNPNKWGV